MNSQENNTKNRQDAKNPKTDSNRSGPKYMQEDLFLNPNVYRIKN